MICKGCLNKVHEITQEEKDKFEFAFDAKYYCDWCDILLYEFDEVASGVVIDADGNREFW